MFLKGSQSEGNFLKIFKDIDFSPWAKHHIVLPKIDIFCVFGHCVVFVTSPPKLHFKSSKGLDKVEKSTSSEVTS